MGGRSTLRLWAWLEVALGLALAGTPSFAQDADGDGLPDAVEEQLGTDKALAETLTPLGTFPAGNTEAARRFPELDIVRVDFGNVAKDRWLWAVHFAKPYTFANSLLIIYLDADNDPATGRKGMGCEVMLSHRRGVPGISAFAPDGSPGEGSLPRVALVNGVLYLCHDGAIKQEGGHSIFRFSVLSETAEPHAFVDSTGWLQAKAPPNSEREKVIMLDDITENENFEVTEGLDLIWQLQANPANIVLSSVQGELQGMAYYDAEYRWPAVRGANGTITLKVPRGGTFYPAVVVYDTAGKEAYELLVEGKRVGRFLAAEDDRRQRIFFLSQPIEFQGGERLTLRTGAVGQHITEDILLLAERPPVRRRTFEIRYIQAEHVRHQGEEKMRLTWITTWPVACTVEYGPSPENLQRVAEERPLANHRLYLSGLERGTTYRFRIVAPRPDGQTVASPEMAFTFAPPPLPKGKAQRERLSLRVENPYDFPWTAFPITSGVPFAQGELADPASVRLLNREGQEVPLQAQATMRWRDGSVKWLLLSFLATVGAKQTAEYTLEYGSQVSRRTFPTPLRALRQGETLVVETGPLRVRFDAAKSGLPTEIWFDADGDGEFKEEEELTGGRGMEAWVKDEQGHLYTAAHPPERLEVEEEGPVRVVVKVEGHHRSEDGAREFFAYTHRFVFYAGLPFVRFYHAWGNDREEAEFTLFEGLGIRVPLSKGAPWEWRVGLGQGQTMSGRGFLALDQWRDDGYGLTPALPTPPRRADGWLQALNGRWGVTVAVRDFWQLYPKSLRFTPEGLEVDLCPDFPPGTYDGCTKLEEIKWFYALMGGRYKVRLGLRKQHEMMLLFHPAAGEEALRWAEAFQEPLIAVCPPERYCESQVFGEVLPATTGRWPDYEEVCERVYRNYVRQREEGREYGMFNFGDQWGERRVNWANGEYDHTWALLLQFVRTGERRWYFLADRAARHFLDVDTCHFGPRRGGYWVHAMGHTGDYFTEPYEGSGIPRGGFTVSHTWTEGFFAWFALSGDPTAWEAATMIADYYDGAYLNNYDYSNCRDNGWHLILTLAAYRATNDPYYLNAARIIVERTLERQTPGGGWHRQMVPGHCYDMPRHRGEANFMLGVLANGLWEYFREVPDPRVAEALIGGAKQVVQELWVEEVNGFRYTSCPNMKGYIANNDMTTPMLFFAHRVGGERRFAEIALRAMKAAFAGGIGSIAHLRWAPRLLYHMDLLRQEGIVAP